MKHLFSTSLALALALLAAHDAEAWQPTGSLASVPVYRSCQMTDGDIGMTLPGPVIYWCQATAMELEAYYPGASLFYWAHEYGHVAEPFGGEAGADCWAARQLAAWGDYGALRAAVRHFQDRGWEWHPGYGTGFDRAARIRTCAGL